MAKPGIDIVGLRPAQRKLDRIEFRTRKKYLRRAVSAAGTQLSRSTKRATPVDTGLLRKSIGRRVRSFRGGTVAVAIVGPRTGFERIDEQGNTVDPARYGNAVQGRTNFMGIGAARGESASVSAFGTKLGELLEQDARKR